MTDDLSPGPACASPASWDPECGERIDTWLLRFEAAWKACGTPLGLPYDTAVASKSPAVALKLAGLVLTSLVYHSDDARTRSGSAPPRPRDAAACAALLYAVALRWELPAQAVDNGPRSGFSGADSRRCGETQGPVSRDWDVSTSNVRPSTPPGKESEHIYRPPDHKMLLDLVRGLSRLYRDNAIPKGNYKLPSSPTGLSANVWHEGVRSTRILLDCLDSDIASSASPTSCTIKAHALYILSVAAPDADVHLRRLADLPDAGEPLLPEADALVYSALRRLSMPSPRRGTLQSTGPVPEYTVSPPSPSSVAFPCPPSPVPIPSSPSHSHSRTHSRSESLFSVVVTPASYVSTATSPANSSPLSSSLDCKPVSVHEPKCRNPLLDRALGRRARRAHSLHGPPTLALTRCNSQSMASFAPPECTLPNSSTNMSTAPRGRSPIPNRAQSMGPGQRSATLPSAETATRSLKALYAQVDDRPTARRVRPSLPWAKTWWSMPGESPTSPNKTGHDDAHAPTATRSRSLAPAPTIKKDPDAPGLDAVLARQERASRLLGARECATCGTRGGAFPQCARGCGVAWCSRDCRMQNRKAHKEVCSVAVVGRVTVT